MNEILRPQHDQKREIVFKGQLQQKITKKYGTLFRRKRVIYDDELWVVLCVHEGGNGGIPHMEWYDNLQSIYDHRPRTVQDLLDCQYVNVAIGEERCIVIGFVDKNRPILELSAPSLEARQQWIDKLTTTLRRLKCLIDDNGAEQADENNACYPRADNEYIALNDIDAQESASSFVQSKSKSHSSCSTVGHSVNHNQQQTTKKFPILDTIPTDLSSSTSNLPTSYDLEETNILMKQQNVKAQLNQRMQISSPTCSGTIPHNSRETIKHQISQENAIINATKQVDALNEQRNLVSRKDDYEEEQLIPPPLPPRKDHQLHAQQQQQQSIPLLPNSPIPSSPPTTSHLNSSFDDFQSQYDRLIPNISHQYELLTCFSCPQHKTNGPICISDISSSTSIANDSTPTSSTRNSDVEKRSLPEAQYDILSNTLQLSNFSSDNNFVDDIFLENMSRPRKISLALSVLVENVAFVDNGKKIWIAGWSPKVDTNLRNIVHFGDEVVKISGIEIQNIQQLSEIYAKTRPGVPIELLLRANPRSKVFTLLKTENPKKEMGIVLHKKKNKIAFIERMSPADCSGIPTHLPPYFFNPSPHRDEVPAIITELDGIPMDLYARNDQFFRRLEQKPIGSSINLTIHPEDFCKLIASQLKIRKNFNHFVHNF